MLWLEDPMAILLGKGSVVHKNKKYQIIIYRSSYNLTFSIAASCRADIERLRSCRMEDRLTHSLEESPVEVSGFLLSLL